MLSEQERTSHEITLAEKRIRELDDKFNKLYDDRLEGMLSDNRFRELSARCEDEQAKLKTRLEELKSQVNQQEETESNVSRFVDEAKRYSNIKELDREILNRLIDKIVVSDSVIENGVKTQKIRIFYKFLGDLA